MKIVLTVQAWAAEYAFSQTYQLDTGHLDAYTGEAERPAEGRRLMRQRESMALDQVQAWAEAHGEPVARMELSWDVVPETVVDFIPLPPGTPARQGMFDEEDDDAPEA